MLRALAIVGALALLVGCGPTPRDWPAGKPRIDLVRFLEQTPQNPQTLAFELLFEDTDGDLGAGLLHLEIQCERTSSLALPDVFAAQIPPLDPKALEGRLEVHVNVEGRVEVGERVQIGFILEDASGEPSNTSSVSLEAVDTQARSGGDT